MKLSKKIRKIGVLIFIIFIISIFIISQTNAFNLIGAIVGAISGGIMGALKGGTCKLYVAPGEGKCGECGAKDIYNGFLECNEYWCKSLGGNCQFDSISKSCSGKLVSDVTPPSFDKCQAKNLLDSSDYNVELKQDACIINSNIKAYDSMVVYLHSTEEAICRVSMEEGSKFGDNPKDQNSNTMGEGLPDKDFLFALDFSDVNDDFVRTCKDGNCVFYISCIDGSGNEMGANYRVILKSIVPGEDKAGPQLLRWPFDQNFRFSKSVEKIPVFDILVYDSSGVKGCKYNKDSDNNYNAMSPMICSPSTDEFGWLCVINDLGIKDGENKVFVKCEDNLGNINIASYIYTFLRSDSDLSVVISSPNEGSTLSGNNLELTADVSPFSDQVGCFYKYKYAGGEFSQEGAMSLESGLFKISMDNFLKNNGHYDVQVRCSDGLQEDTEIVGFNFENPELNIEISYTDPVNVNYVDVNLDISGGRNNDGLADCYYKKLGSNDIISNIQFSSIAVETNRFGSLGSGQYTKRIQGLDVGDNRFYIACQERGVQGNIKGAEYHVNYIVDGFNVEYQSTTDIGNSVLLTVYLTGGYEKYGQGACYYSDKHYYGIEESNNFDTSYFKSDQKFLSNSINLGEIGKQGSGTKYTSPIPIVRGVQKTFYVKCKDAKGTLSELIMFNIYYQGGGTGGTTPKCTSNLDCDTGKICNSDGVCVSSSGGGAITGTGPLTILSAGPTGNIGTKEVKLFIALNGGADEFGKNLNCYYYTGPYDPVFARTTGIKLSEFNSYFTGTNNKLISYEFITSGTMYYKMFNLTNGNYTYYLACKDSVDSISDVEKVSFSISEDITPPILQFYTEGSLFRVRLNERGSCFVKDVNNFVDMSADTGGIIHSTPIRADKTYIIRCKDVWNNWYPGENDFITVVKNE